jgi:hypothetical protein
MDSDFETESRSTFRSFMAPIADDYSGRQQLLWLVQIWRDPPSVRGILAEQLHVQHSRRWASRILYAAGQASASQRSHPALRLPHPETGVSVCLRSVPTYRSYIFLYLRNTPFKCDSAPGRSFCFKRSTNHECQGSTKVTTRLSSGPSTIDQQRRAGGKFGCVGSKVKDGSRDFFAGAEPAHRVQR